MRHVHTDEKYYITCIMYLPQYLPVLSITYNVSAQGIQSLTILSSFLSWVAQIKSSVHWPRLYIWVGTYQAFETGNR